jgi:hypothetical protein
MHKVPQPLYPVISGPRDSLIVEKKIRSLGTQSEKIFSYRDLILEPGIGQPVKDILCKKAMRYDSRQMLLLSDNIPGLIDT